MNDKKCIKEMILFRVLQQEEHSLTKKVAQRKERT
jgi:hypothetical protein